MTFLKWFVVGLVGTGTLCGVAYLLHRLVLWLERKTKISGTVIFILAICVFWSAWFAFLMSVGALNKPQ